LTVIAYKDGVLAADTLVTEPDNYLNIGYSRKIHKTPDGALVGANGDCEYCLKFLEWANSDRTTKPPKTIDKCDGAILITPQGEIHYFYGTTWEVLHNDFVTIGSGGPIAMGAMEVGANAYAAVVATCKWSMACGGNIDIERLDDEKVETSSPKAAVEKG
jgi:hypothetical protein